MSVAEKTGTASLHIPQDEIQFHPHSFADVDGRLFTSGEALYRGISAGSSHFFDHLFQSGLIRQLIERGLLIESQIAPLSSDGYELIIRHRKLAFNSYPNEWCAPMLKDAALIILDLLLELSSYGLTLKDGHPWNVLFDGPRPIYVDLTSIIPSAASNWAALDEFSRFCTYPLFMMANGQERIARCLLFEYQGVRRSEAIALARRRIPSRFVLNRLTRRATGVIRRTLDRDGGRQGLHGSLKDLRRDVERINLSSNKKTDEASPEAIAAGFVRQRILSEVCARVRPQSVLVVSGDSSGDARAAAATGCPVVSLEADPDRAARLYDEACEKGLAVLSLVMDFVKPTPSIGFSSHYSIAAHERLGCDLVWAPTLVDDLVLRKYLRFELAAEGLAQFSKRWLLVGFHGQPGSNAPLWYTLDNFTQALKKHFLIVEVIRLDSDPRVLVLCEKKQSA